MSESEDRVVMNRREALLLSATAGLSLAMGRPAQAMDNTKTAAHQEPGNCSTPRTAVANTQSGKVRGFLDGGVFTFKGVPYGQNRAARTAGCQRSLQYPGRTSTQLSSTEPIVPSACTISRRSSSRSSKIGTTAT